MPPNTARRPGPCGFVDNAPALPTTPQGQPPPQKRSIDALQRAVNLTRQQQRARVVLIVAARRSGGRLDCRAGRRSAGAAFAFEGGAAAIAFDVHLEDGGVVDKAIDDSERHRLVGEDLSPFAERLVGCDQQGSPLVSGTDEFEQNAGFGVILGDPGFRRGRL